MTCLPPSAPKLEDALGSVCATVVGWAWTRRESSRYDAIDEIDHYVANLSSVAALQTWFNATQLKLTPALTIEDAFAACQGMTDELWSHLVRLHPHWDGHWQVFGSKVAIMASGHRTFERFEALRAQQGLPAWDWTEYAPKARQHPAMVYFWEHGYRPLDVWLTKWLESRCFKEPKGHALAKERAWNEWMADNVLPHVASYPAYTTIYSHAITRNLSSEWARPAKWALVREKMPWLHIAAAWHNDASWLNKRLVDDKHWCDYAALMRLRWPSQFHRILPEMDDATLNAPLQDIWNLADGLDWSWATLQEQLDRLGENEERLDLPGDFLGE